MRVYTLLSNFCTLVCQLTAQKTLPVFPSDPSPCIFSYLDQSAGSLVYTGTLQHHLVGLSHLNFLWTGESHFLGRVAGHHKWSFLERLEANIWIVISLLTDHAPIVHEGKYSHAQHTHNTKTDKAETEYPTISITMTIHLYTILNFAKLFSNLTYCWLP